MADVLLFHTRDGGDVEAVGGELTLTDGYLTAVYLSLFGGNVEDSGRASDARQQWWGNLTESDPAKHYRSATQNLLQALPPTSGNLRKLEAAAKDDCAWLVAAGHAREVRAAASMPALNQLALDVTIVLPTGADVDLPRILQPWRKVA